MPCTRCCCPWAIPENELTRGFFAHSRRMTGVRWDSEKHESVDGIFACGNVVQVHDLVDFVTEEATWPDLAAALKTERSGASCYGLEAGRR